MATETPAGGRFVSWVGFVFGSIMSIAANVLHTWIPQPPKGAPDGWTPVAGWAPSIAAQIGSAVWPVALLLSVEVLSRVQWPTEWAWKLARYGGVGAVGLGSALISYGHLHDVLLAWGYGELGAAVGPLVLDGLMVVSGFALLAHGDKPAKGAVVETPAVVEPETVTPPVVEAPTEPVVEKPRLRSVPAAKARRTVSAAVAEHQEKLAKIVTAGGGRKAVMEELGLTESQARTALEKFRDGSR